MSPLKHVYINQDKEFLVLNGYWIICVSFAVKYIIELISNFVYFLKFITMLTISMYPDQPSHNAYSFTYVILTQYWCARNKLSTF